MKRIFLVITLACLGLVQQALGCANTYDIKLSLLLHSAKKTEITSKLAKLENAYFTNPNQVNSNDLAVGYLYTANYQKAVDILLDLEKRTPGLAFTASNLGTAYELAGNPMQALHWIKEGIVRNPNDHERTEWLHVKILEAKLAISKDPRWLENNSVLGVDFGPWDFPSLPPRGAIDLSGHMHDLKSIRFAIETQLEERLNFVNPPDPIVGDLFATMGYIQILDGEYDNHIPWIKFDMTLQHAIHFKAPHADLIQNRIESKDNASALRNKVFAAAFLTLLLFCSYMVILFLFGSEDNS